jgi:SNF2 family DNA or RNA helicase
MNVFNVIKVALLSITACSHGLNLTAAGTVVFAELYWVPGVIVQAEDRSHRMGTTHSCINVHYIIAQVKEIFDNVCKNVFFFEIYIRILLMNLYGEP